MPSLWHIAFAVPNLEQGMDEFGRAFDLEWRPVHHAVARVTDERGVEHEATCHFTFSVGGPPAIEMWEAVPGTPLDAPGDTVLHHIGYWVDDLAAEGRRLEDQGWPCFMSAHSVAIHRGPGGILLEPCDVLRDRPFLRDLFPPGTPHHGEPRNDDRKHYALGDRLI
jgi:hypothetical protein